MSSASIFFIYEINKLTIYNYFITDKLEDIFCRVFVVLKILIISSHLPSAYLCDSGMKANLSIIIN